MSLRETLERIRSSPPPGNEEMAKFQILAPVLADLFVGLLEALGHRESDLEYVYE